MNPGQYHHRRPQIQHGLPLTSCQYAESPEESSAQSPLQNQMFSFDGLPRTVPDQQFMTIPSSTASLVSSNYTLVSPMSQSTNTAWTDSMQLSSTYDEQNGNGYYGYSSSLTGDGHEGAYGSRAAMNLADVPRSSWPQYDQSMLSDGNMSLDAYEPSAYMLDANEHELPCKDSTFYNTIDNSRDFTRLSLSRSPKMENDPTMGTETLSFNTSAPFRVPSSEASDDGHAGNCSREMTTVEVDGHGADEPYAKLIYRALMSAPNHSMALQEIYQWFRENTAKGTSDSKGWMNSIRHNLSMNAAFKKTERRLSTDKTKKSTEWVLEDFAIKDGVQSTTRYRKGTNSSKKFTKSENHHLQRNRQISGRKGGEAASKIKFQRLREQRMSGREDSLGGARRTVYSTRRAQFQNHRREQIGHRHRSPLTPPHPESMLVLASSPYYFHKAEQYEMPFKDMVGVGLADVQGVYVDEPLFASGAEGVHFHGGIGGHEMGGLDHRGF